MPPLANPDLLIGGISLLPLLCGRAFGRRLPSLPRPSPAVREAGIGEPAEWESLCVRRASWQSVRGPRGQKGRVGAGPLSLTVALLLCSRRLASAGSRAPPRQRVTKEGWRGKRLVGSRPGRGLTLRASSPGDLRGRRPHYADIARPNRIIRAAEGTGLRGVKRPSWFWGPVLHSGWAATEGLRWAGGGVSLKENLPSNS